MNPIEQLEQKLHKETLEYQSNLRGANLRRVRKYYSATQLGKLLLEGEHVGISHQQYKAAQNFIKLQTAYLNQTSKVPQTTIDKPVSKISKTDNLQLSQLKNAYSTIHQELKQHFNSAALELMQMIFFDKQNLPDRQLKKAAPQIRQICNRLAKFFESYHPIL